MLAVVAITLSTVHARLGLARIDELLAGDLTSATGVFRNEISERLAVPDAARDALSELEIPGTGIAIVGRGGQVFASSQSSAPKLSSAIAGIRTDSPVTIQTADGPVRARAMDIVVSGEVCRVPWHGVDGKSIAGNEALPDRIIFGAVHAGQPEALFLGREQ